MGLLARLRSRRGGGAVSYRTPLQRHVAKWAVALNLLYIAAVWGLWRLTTDVPRQDYSAVREEVSELCERHRPGDEGEGADPLQLPEVVDHLHLAYTLVVGDPSAAGAVDWAAGAREAAAGARRFADGVAAAGLRVTADFQSLYYADPLLASTGKVTDFLNTQDLKLDSHRAADHGLRPLRRDLTLLLYIDGSPPEGAAFAAATRCSVLQGFGSVCHVAAAPRNATPARPARRRLSAAELRPAFREWDRALLRFAGWPGGTAPEEWLRRLTRRAAAQACRTLRAFFAALDEIAGLPLPAEVHRGAALAAARGAGAVYFDHTLTQSTYFPPDHLVAIYLPFFFPVLVTVFAGVVTEVKQRRRERHAAAAAPVAVAGCAAAAVAGRRASERGGG